MPLCLSLSPIFDIKRSVLQFSDCNYKQLYHSGSSVVFFPWFLVASCLLINSFHKISFFVSTCHLSLCQSPLSISLATQTSSVFQDASVDLTCGPTFSFFPL